VSLDRSSIRRSDFPTVRRGYDPAAVDAHLREIAAEVERLRRGGGQPVAVTASEQVRRIVEAAEASAEQLRAEAGEEAREHVHRVSTAARELLERIGAMHEELGELMDRLREDAGRLSAELRTLERDASEVGLGPAELDAGAVAPGDVDAGGPGPAEPDVAPAGRDVAEDGAAAGPDGAEAEPEVPAARPKRRPEPTPGAKPPAAAEPPASKPDDDEAARLVALDMALSGTPREETERYLAQHYSLAKPDELLDDVYSLAGQ
jgi:DivIVA domain-containing protein